MRASLGRSRAMSRSAEILRSWGGLSPMNMVPVFDAPPRPPVPPVKPFTASIAGSAAIILTIRSRIPFIAWNEVS